jgi:hypothetical protein
MGAAIQDSPRIIQALRFLGQNDWFSHAVPCLNGDESWKKPREKTLCSG